VARTLTPSGVGIRKSSIERDLFNSREKPTSSHRLTLAK